MTGLEKIVKHIEEDANNTAQTVITQARLKADEIMNSAKAEGERMSAQIIEKSQKEVKDCLSRGESAALLQEKKMILEAKQQIIAENIEHAKSILLALPNKEYFSIIIKMVQKHALGRPGEIAFSAKDKQQIPDQFESMLATALTAVSGASLTLSEQIRDMNGGFVLIYGDVEENCSFDALFLAAKESLQDKVGALLFE